MNVNSPVLLFVALAIAGCGIARRHELQARTEALQQQSTAAMQECDAKFPKDIAKIAVARAQCANGAFAIMRPVVPYPDLWDLYMASLATLAERVQNGQLTIIEANEAFAQRTSELVAEEQRRQLANRSVAGQEMSALGSLQSKY